MSGPASIETAGRLTGDQRNLFGRVACFALFLAVTSLFLFKAGFVDFWVYHKAGTSLLEGRTDFYASDFGLSSIMDYRYPPYFLFVFLPFSLIPLGIAKYLWFYLNMIAVYAAVIVTKRKFELITADRKRVIIIFTLAVMICLKYFISLLLNPNVHLIVLCFVFAAFLLSLRSRYLSGAFLMAQSIAFKIFPILMLPYFALKKQWSFLVLTVGFVIVLNLLPAFYLGFNSNLRSLGQWYEHVIENTEFHELNGPINLSLKGQLVRTLSPIDYSERKDDPNYQNINILSLSQGTISIIYGPIAIAIFAGTLLTIWYSSKRRYVHGIGQNDKEGTNRFDEFAFLEFGLVICMMLLLEPRTNIYYFVALFFPLVGYIKICLDDRTIVNKVGLVLILVLSCVLPLVPGAQSQRLFLVLGTDLALTLILWAALGYNLFLRSCRSRETTILA